MSIDRGRSIWTLALAMVVLATVSACGSADAPDETSVGQDEAAEADPVQTVDQGAALELSEQPVTLLESPDGQWVAERLTSPMDDDGGWRSQLRVIGQSRVGERGGFIEWVAFDEYLNGGICADDREALGWSRDGRSFFFAQPGCGEGCTRFAGVAELWRLDLGSGEVGRIVGEEGREIGLTPDGMTVAYLARQAGGPELVLQSTASGARRSLALEGGTASGGSIVYGSIVWAPDGDRLAIGRVDGRCPEEDATATILVDVERLASRELPAPEGALLLPARWPEADRLVLRALDGRDADATWWHVTPSSGAHAALRERADVDGRHLAFVEAIDLASDPPTITVDAALWYGGGEATVAAREDGAIGAYEEVPNGFYIRNASREAQRVPLAAACELVLVDAYGAPATAVTALADFARAIAGDRESVAGAPRPVPFWITVLDGAAVRIEQQYLP